MNRITSYSIFIAIVIISCSCRQNKCQVVAKLYSSVEKSTQAAHTEGVSLDIEIDIQAAVSNLRKSTDSIQNKPLSPNHLILKSFCPNRNPNTEPCNERPIDKDLMYCLQIEKQLQRIESPLQDHDSLFIWIDHLESMLDHKSDPLDKYYLAKLHLQKSMYLYLNNQYQYAAASAQYGRHLLKHLQPKLAFPYTDVQLSIQLAISLEENTVMATQVRGLCDAAYQTATRHNYEALKSELQLRRGPSNIRSMWNQCKSDEQRALLLTEYVYGYYLIGGNKIDDMHLLEGAYRYLTKPKDRSAYLQYMYYILCKDDLERASQYMQEALHVVSSSLWHQQWIDYYNLELQIDYQQRLYAETDNPQHIDIAIEKSAERIQLSNILFPDPDESHIDDLAMGQAVELAKLLSLQDELSARDVRLFFQLLSRAQAQELKKLNTAVRSENGRMLTATDRINVRIARLEAELSNYLDLTDASSTKYKELYYLHKSRADSLHNTPPEDLNLEQLQQKFAEENSAFIGYLVYPDEDIICYMIDEEHIYIAAIAEDNLAGLTQSILDHSLMDANLNLEQLASTMVPFDISHVRRIYVTPDGSLDQFPLPLLFSDQQQLIHVTSASQILQSDREDLDATNSALFNLSSNQTIKDKTTVKDHSELVDGLAACTEIAKHLQIDNRQVITGSKMTKEVVIQNLNTDLLHLSTHGFSNDTIVNKNSFLVRDGMTMIHVNATEIDGLANYPKFIYLDGCNTGSGVSQIGEGTYSLARVFAKNGTKALIKTLWPIDGKSSAFFATSYYQHWATGLSAADAFYQAQRDTKEQYPEPYHWGPYVYYGNPDLYLQ